MDERARQRLNLVCLLALDLWLALGTAPPSAQTWRWGQEFRIRSNETPDAIIGRIGARYYSTRFRSLPFSQDELALDMFSFPDLAYAGGITLLPRNTYVEDGDLRALPEYEGIFILGNHIVLFLSAFDKNRTSQVLYGLRYDTLGQFLNMVRLVETHNATRPNKGQFRLVPTLSQKNLWLILSHPQDKNDLEQFEFFLFNDSLQNLYRRTLTLPYKDRQFEMTDLLPDGENQLFMLGKVYPERPNRERGLPDFEYSVLKLRISPPEEVQELVLRDAPYPVADLALARTKSGLALCGFFARPASEGVAGTLLYSLAIDSLRVLRTAHMPFDKNFVQEALGEKKAPRNPMLSRFGLKEVVTGPEGDLFIVGEQFWMQEICVRDARGFLYCNYHYFYNSILVIHADTSGEIRNTYVIPKFQNSLDDDGYFLSYALAVNDSGLYFVFLDNPKNRQAEKPADYRDMNRPQKADAVLVQLGFGGGLQKKILFNAEAEGWTLRPKFSRQVGADEIMVLALGGNNKIRMCQIRLKEL